MKQQSFKLVSLKKSKSPNNTFLDFNNTHKVYKNIPVLQLQHILNSCTHLESIYLKSMLNQSILSMNRLKIPSNIKNLRIENIAGHSQKVPLYFELNQSLEFLIIKNVQNIILIFKGYNPSFKIRVACSKKTNNFEIITENINMKNHLRSLINNQMLLSDWISQIYDKTKYSIKSIFEMKAGFNRLGN
ncbi:hypothetical protein DID75_02965 [Candidatus Marinamargulisbacteria bacterium SCGC AG-410-N11]|nr:hypothetical protein DID75_02965 [Candidatus Marinamargulisbacteria bacterium SCGC AG-410-N11]